MEKQDWKWKKVKSSEFGKIIEQIAFFDFNRFFKIAYMANHFLVGMYFILS